MKNLLTIAFLFISVAVFAQPVRTTITSDGVNVTISTPVNTKVISVCDFHWSFSDGNIKLWIEGNNEIIPGGRLGSFTVNGATTQASKLAALGAISEECSGGIGGTTAADIPLSPAIDFGGVEADTVQEALNIIDARLDSAMNNTNDGAILYVTKNGNDSNGQRGNYFKPFLTINAAITASSDDDLIVVYPGNYADGSVDLSAKRLNYYFYKNAACTDCGFDTANPSVVKGQGTFLVSSRARIFNGPTTASGVKYVMECDSAYVNSLCWDAAYDFDFKSRVLRTGKGGGSYCMVGVYNSLTDTTATKTWRIETDRYECISCGIVSGSNPRRDVIFSANYTKLTGGVWQSQNNTNGNNGHTVLNLGIVEDANAFVGTYIYFDSNSSRNFNNFTFDVNIKRMTFNDAFIYYLSYAGSNNKNARYTINCDDCIFTDTSQFVYAVGTINTTFPLEIKGNYKCTNGGAAVKQLTGTWNLMTTFSGSYKTNSTWSGPFAFPKITSGKVQFENCKILTNSSSIAPISATVASSVGTWNVATNSTTDNPNITYLIESIIKSTSLR